MRAPTPAEKEAVEAAWWNLGQYGRMHESPVPGVGEVYLPASGGASKGDIWEAFLGEKVFKQPGAKKDGNVIDEGDKLRGMRKGGDDEKKFTATVILDFIEDHYKLICSTMGNAYAIPIDGVRLPIPMGRTGGALRRKVQLAIRDQHDTSVAKDSLGNALDMAVARALESSERKHLHLRAAHVGDTLVLDLAQPNSTRCVVITPDGWTIEDEPPAGILFERPASLQPLPDPVVSGSFEPLRKVLGFTDERHWALVRGWLVASVLADIPRPCLLFLGAAGSAKTSRAKAIVNVLDPREELGGSFGRNLDDDRVKALNRFLVGYDNLSKMTQEVSDHLCRLVTGDSSEKRANYSDGDSYVMSYRRTGVMTAVSLPPMKSDALERFIPLQLPTMTTGRKSEWKVRQELDQAYPDALGAVCDGVATMLKRLPDLIREDPDGPRMKDYWLALLAYDEDCAKAYRTSAASVLKEAAEDDPFVQIVAAWVDGSAVSGWWQGSMTEAYTTASKMRASMPALSGYDNSWWPANGQALSRKLKEQERPLLEAGIRFERQTSGPRTLRIGRVQHPLWQERDEQQRVRASAGQQQVA